MQNRQGALFLNTFSQKYPQDDCFQNVTAGPGMSVGCASAWHADGRGFDPRVRQHSFVENSHEIISTAILSLPLIQVGQLSVTAKMMCT